MAVIVAGLGVLIVCGSVVALCAHGLFTRMIGFWLHGTRLYGAAAVRLVFGTLLIVAAPETRMPAAVQALGVLTIAAAVAVPLPCLLPAGRFPLSLWERVGVRAPFPPLPIGRGLG